MHWYAENKNVFNKRLKLSVVRTGSRRLSGKAFQAVGPATAKGSASTVERSPVPIQTPSHIPSAQELTSNYRPKQGRYVFTLMTLMYMQLYA